MTLRELIKIAKVHDADESELDSEVELHYHFWWHCNNSFLPFAKRVMNACETHNWQEFQNIYKQWHTGDDIFEYMPDYAFLVTENNYYSGFVTIDKNVFNLITCSEYECG